ncbi:MAG: tetratricopeptide repeat protein [Pseudomonadales bacterium]|jgi:tetratricopeptide (TPR) repeat protein|nr:tetratricopeptide repeat protein [Pseudomonadales bacterium]
MTRNFHFILAALVYCGAGSALADLGDDVQHLQQRWAEVNYQLDGKTQLAAFEQLMNEAKALTSANASEADAWVWSGIIKSTYAGAKGGLGALALAKEAKADLERALTLDPTAQAGAAYTSLGALYYNVPGWPVGFGDSKKAEELLKQALVLAPDDIDANYFYADFLIEKKRYAEARSYLQKAQQAAPRPGRELADAGRREEIAEELQQIARK